MKIIKIEVNNTRFEFVCDSRDTRHGFAHDCNMFINDFREQKATCHYLNRTWECWTYQSACIEAVNQEMEYRKNGLIAAFKAERNISRMTAKRQAEFTPILKNDSYYQTLTSCKQLLRDKIYY